jgi:hypothetical protein
VGARYASHYRIGDVAERERFRALLERHQAALNLIKGGFELDRELLLSYVVWPTERIDAVVAARIASGRSARTRVPARHRAKLAA